MKQAMIFAAGLGTRLKPLTNKMPKALVRVGGEPLLKHTVLRLKDAGFTRIVVNVHHFSEQIVDYLKANNHFDMDIRISDETEALLETGGGVKKAIPLFDNDFPILIHNVDILDNLDYEWFARQHLATEDALLLVSRRKTKRYLLFDHSMRLMGWTNVETGEIRSPFAWLRASRLTIDDSLNVHLDDHPQSAHLSTLYAFAFSGIHLFSPRLFPLMDKFPDRFSIMDFYLQTCHRAQIYGCVKDDLRILDVGKQESLEEAEKFLKTITNNR